MSLSRHITAMLAALVIAAQGHAQGTLLLPSGVEALPHDMIWDEDLSAIRLRFVVPRLAEPGSLYAADPERVFEDMLWLCETQVAQVDPGLDTLLEEGWNSVAISLMDQIIDFGERDADVIQVFEWFALTMDGCDLELDIYHD